MDKEPRPVVVQERLKNLVPEKEYAFKTNCYPHQMEAFLVGTHQRSLLLCDEQGLGKTKEAVDIISYRHQKGQVKKALVVCGVNGTKYNWENEIRLHSSDTAVLIDGKSVKKKEAQIKSWLAGPALYGIINIEALRREELMIALNGRCEAVIIDEAHKAKNGLSQQGKAIRQLMANYKIAMTGTPMFSRVEDLWNILSWLGVETRPFTEFRDAYCYQDRFGAIIGYRNLGALTECLDRVMLRRRKRDVLQLPEKIRQTEYVSLTAAQLEKYRSALSGILMKDGKIVMDWTNNGAITILTRLREITDGVYVEPEDDAKLLRVKELLSEEIIPNGGKAILFSNWTKVTGRYREELKEYEPAYITGEIAADKRQEEADRFQTDANCKIIIGTIGAMGNGFTLHAASAVIFIDKGWYPEENAQAEDRAHRIGMKSQPINILSMVAKDTIDEKIEERLRQNQAIFHRIMDPKSMEADLMDLLEMPDSASDTMYRPKPMKF